jgi:hypothetical protein
MVRGERKFYTEEFNERVLTAYYNSKESVSIKFFQDKSCRLSLHKTVPRAGLLIECRRYRKSLATYYPSHV